MGLHKDNYKEAKSGQFGYIFDACDKVNGNYKELKLEDMEPSERMCFLLTIVNEAIIDEKLKEFFKPFLDDLREIKEFNKPSKI